MGKKSVRTNQPNAPELQQMLLDSDASNNITHPPTNPYYPELSTALSRSQLPPPPYNDLSAPMMSTTSVVPLGYIHHQQQAGDMPRQLTSGATSVVISRPNYYDHRAAKQNRRVRRFNNEVFLCSLLTAVLAICAYRQYDNRTCLYEFIVHKPSADLEITIGNVRDSHILVFYISVALMLLSLVKCMFGDCKNYSCYLFVMAVVSLLGTLLTVYIAWLAFYSPCGTNLKNLATNTLKTIAGKMVDTLPSPDKGIFGESNVLQQFKDGHDVNGLVVFMIDAFNCILYLSLFISSTILC